ncbi:methyltransferase-like protein 25 [Chrysoperla carnea]|uniref:methyltransferase-like protein 25 n=1 Tax=Chrysoperla carnea TaxID=189513 RepID=UPI001D0898A4|nr:methyltransferase-like protein 25 [Chrysoperla carnea]
MLLKLNNLIKFLNPYLEFINCHMVEFYTNNLWDKYIPKNIQNELTENGFEDAFNIIYKDKNYDKYPNLTVFLNEIKNIRENNSIIVSKDNFLKDEKPVDEDFKHFMSDKKIHEVNKMADLTYKLSKNKNIEYVVDIGDGKGYLSSYLSLKYKLNVLGIDSQSINTTGSSKRLQKLQKYWKGLTNDSIISNSYKQFTKYVTSSTNLIEILQNEFNQSNIDRFALVGLHTCGQLACDSLDLFVNDANCKFLCNVGCCYHLLKTFPMSDYVKNQNFNLDRNARMIASQSIDRTVNQQKINNQSLFYRGLFQVFLQNKYGLNLPEGQVGRKCSKHNNFIDYCRSALNNYQSINDSIIVENELNDLLNKYQENNDDLKLYLFYLIRMQFSSIIELLILTDRCMYLIENGFNQTYLIQLFNSVISPRHLAIISIK